MGKLLGRVIEAREDFVRDGNGTRRNLLILGGVAAGGLALGMRIWDGSDAPPVQTIMFASSSGVELKKHLDNKDEGSWLFPGFNFTILAENGKTIDWQRDKIEKKDWMADCAPYALAIINVGLNDLLNRRPAADIFKNDFIPVYDTVTQRCRANGKRVSVFGAYPVARREGDWKWFVKNQRDFNDLESNYAVTHGGLPIDPFNVLADSDGIVREGLSDDGTHINFSGWKVLSTNTTSRLHVFVGC